jgi:hypothetical protein
MDGAMNGRPKRPRELFSDPAPVLNHTAAKAEFSACGRKREYDTMEDALYWIPATQAVYRCPFGDQDHWHRLTKRDRA